jgi:uncharacterized membrane protein
MVVLGPRFDSVHLHQKLMIKWLKNRISSKLDHFSGEKIKGFLKKNGLAFVIIFIGWEIVEDVVFPLIFGALGNYVHPAFYAGIPASLILCLHWLAIPILWGLWVKLTNRSNVDVDADCCK